MPKFFKWKNNNFSKNLKNTKEQKVNNEVKMPVNKMYSGKISVATTVLKKNIDNHLMEKLNLRQSL